MDVGQLKRIPLFSDAADDELKKVAVFAESKEVPAGTEVVREGGFSTELLAIEDGTAEVTREGKKVAELKKGDIFGETGLLEDEMRNSTVIATSPLKLISMGHFELKRLKKAAPDVYARIEQLVEDRKGS
jgi:CRP/FNR family transcriptional regulator, cyclic AMP receptor protein